MKYCVKCGNSMEDEMLFCQKCGATCATLGAGTANCSSQDSYAEYWGLHYKDAESGHEIELVPEGVHIFHTKGMKRFRYDKTIPYTKIIDLNMERASVLKSGYLSIITTTEGITGKARRQQLLFNHNTVLFTKKTQPEAEPIYRALKDICNAPPLSSSSTTYCESNSNVRSSISAFLSNPTQLDKRTGCLIPVIAFAVFLIVIFAIPKITTSSQQEEAGSIDDIGISYDVVQFANISGDELIALLGEPDSISEGTCTGAFEVPCVYYDYNNEETLGEVSFALVNNNVARFTSYNNYQYFDGNDMLARYGVEKGADCVIAADSGSALRYRCPSATVDDFWISLIENNTFGFLQVTYDMLYYEEWYLPMSISDQSNYQYWTQEAVKMLLKAPKTANFPNINDWTTVENQFYVAAQSYVDAQNSFGAEVRSEFTFIYQAGTSNIVYATFDGEVIADNGYVPTADLVSQLVSEMGR